ncbi:MAG: WavE lipopolysaccharide synthesis family protein [Patescibacteria group bacterium]|jgi:hypothetical protein
MKIKELFIDLIKKTIYQAENLFGFFFTFHLRPIKADTVKIAPITFSKLPLCAIVIQGQVLYEKNFTRETLKIYRHNFPSAILILSTWEDEKSKYIEEIKALGIEIVLNKKPTYSGIGNINFQIISTNGGLEKAQEFGAQYILKTRTDQRFHNPSALEYFINLQKTFPVPTGYAQKQRIISVNLDTFRNRMHEISDMLIFGQLDDMLIYWNTPTELPEYAAALATETAKIKAGQRGPIEQEEFPICERKLSSNFLKSIGRTLTWTHEDSHKTLANHFCIIDAEDIDLYWHKYARLHERRHHLYNQENFWDKHEVSFAEWLNIHCAYKK